MTGAGDKLRKARAKQEEQQRKATLQAEIAGFEKDLASGKGVRAGYGAGGVSMVGSPMEFAKRQQSIEEELRGRKGELDKTRQKQIPWWRRQI